MSWPKGSGFRRLGNPAPRRCRLFHRQPGAAKDHLRDQPAGRRPLVRLSQQGRLTRGSGTPYMPPSVRLPYPWARSVNGLEFADTGGGFGPLEGQLVLCEYNNRFILRASLDTVDGQEQGACYPFLGNLLGPLCLAFSPTGVLYVGSIREPAWGAPSPSRARSIASLLRPAGVRHPGSDRAGGRLRADLPRASGRSLGGRRPPSLPDPPLPRTSSRARTIHRQPTRRTSR